MNLMMLLDMAASGFGDRTAVGTRDGGITYRRLFELANATARLLRDGDADHLAMVDTSSHALPVALFGAAWADRPFVPLNFRLPDDELGALLGRIAPAAVVVEPGSEDRLAPAGPADLFDRHVFLDRVADPSGRHGPASDWGYDGDAVAVLLFTSGTTGAPKAAVLRHRHLTSYILGSVEFMGAGEDEAALICVPPYHVAGLAAVLSNVYAGRRIVFMDAFDPAAWVATVRAESITSAMVVPTMLARIVDHLDDEGPDGPGLPSLRALSYGGGRMPQPVIERALHLLPEVGFVNAYGLTETSSTVALLGPEDHREAVASDDPEIRARLGSAGRPLPTVEVSIRDDRGEEVPVDTLGDIWVRGEQVSGEYRDQGSRLTADGWFPTNDGGRLDADGFLHVVGRIDDVIVKGGQNISPGDIEAVLHRHPGVVDAAAIGLPDVEWGERIVAAVVAPGPEAPTGEQLRDLVRSRLRSNRTPDHVEFVDELPYNETGKLLRRVLRRRLGHLGDPGP